jgi:hypothetical protein
MLMWNPLNILVVRMQCVEYPHRQSLFKAAGDMIRKDRLRMFYRGYFPNFTAQVQLWFFMQIAYYLEDINTRFTPYLCGALFLMGCAACHPWYLIGMRV